MSAAPTRFVVVGDATLDVTVRSPGTPFPGSDQAASITVGPGGQGANLAVRLARRGAQVTLITAVADDLMGEQLQGALAAAGVALVPLPAPRSGIVVSLVDGAGERAMLSDRVSFEPDALTSPAARSALAGATWIHISGYPLADPASGDGLAAIAGSRIAGQLCSVGGGSIDEGSDLLPRLRIVRPDLVLFNRAEASAIAAGTSAAGTSAAGGSDSAEALAGRLTSTVGGAAVVTDGAAGAAAAWGHGTVTLRGSRGSAVDATGAGDAFAAGILLALAAAPWPPPLNVLRSALEQGIRLGTEAAAVVGAQAPIPAEAGQ